MKEKKMLVVTEVFEIVAARDGGAKKSAPWSNPGFDWCLQGIQLGPTEASRYWVYWVPAQYTDAIKDAILGKWQFFWRHHCVMMTSALRRKGREEHAKQLKNIVIHRFLQADRDKQTVPMEPTSFIAQVWLGKYARIIWLFWNF